MENEITIDWSNVKDAVRKHFSIIGKRLKDKEGNLLFSGVTLSSVEEDILKQYVNAAAEIFVSEMPNTLTYYDSGDFLIFVVKNTRWTDALSVVFEGNFMGYAVSYVADAVLGMNYPDLAKKYALDMQNHINAAIKCVYNKEQPSDSGKTYQDMKGEIELSN